MSAAPHIALAPTPGADVVSLDEWRATRRAPLEADVPEPAPLRLLRLVVDGEAPPPFRLDVFLSRARAVMGETGRDHRATPSYRDAEPA
ncbi:MAG TPA: hypothetical protein VGL44_08555 [Gaiellales bacterium]